MPESALVLFNSLRKYTDLQDLVDDSAAEDHIFECKSPASSRINQELVAKIAKAISAFSNSEGGVILFGASTTRHVHSGRDVVSQLEPIGNVDGFVAQLRSKIPGCTTPSVHDFRITTIRKRPTDSRGCVSLWIPPPSGDPIMTAHDNVFYFRAGEGNVPAPFNVIKRLFAATASPDLVPEFVAPLVKRDAKGHWQIPIVIQNQSSAYARHVEISVAFENAVACESIQADGFRDASSVNPGTRIFFADNWRQGIHRGLSAVVGKFSVRMSVGARPKRRLTLVITCYADRMRARSHRFSLSLATAGFSVRELGMKYLY